MEITKPNNRRHFTDAARAAAAVARRLKKENPAPIDTLKVFAVRQADGRFGWEIRRFGALVIQRSVMTYSSLIEARSAGEQALPEVQ